MPGSSHVWVYLCRTDHVDELDDSHVGSVSAAPAAVSPSDVGIDGVTSDQELLARLEEVARSARQAAAVRVASLALRFVHPQVY